MRSRPARLEERQLAYLWGAAVAASLVLRRLWLALAPALPRCAFRSLTGIPCPTCGTTHAAVALLHGRIGAALAANPLMTLLGLAFLAGGIAAPLWALARGPVPVLRTPLSRWWRLAAVLVLLANWFYLIVTLRRT